MIALQKWLCNNDDCNTIFYTNGIYYRTPNCTECGSENPEKVTDLGVKEYIEAEEIR